MDFKDPPSVESQLSSIRPRIRRDGAEAVSFGATICWGSEPWVHWVNQVPKPVVRGKLQVPTPHEKESSASADEPMKKKVFCLGFLIQRS